VINLPTMFALPALSIQLLRLLYSCGVQFHVRMDNTVHLPDPRKVSFDEVDGREDVVVLTVA